MAKRKTPRFSAEEIVVEIQAKAARDKVRKMSLLDLQKDWSCPLSPFLIGQVFSNRMDAIRAAGLYPEVPNNVDLILSLWDFYLENGQVPRPKDAIDEALPYCEKVYKKCLASDGRWLGVLIAAKMIKAEDCEGQFVYKHMPGNIEMPPEIVEMRKNRTNLAYYKLAGVDSAGGADTGIGIDSGDT